VGVAGWDYKDWRGVVYPAPRPRGFDPLHYLAGYVDLIEINSTFYRPPSRDVAKSWVERVEDCRDFRFSAKLWRRFTHERESPWTRAEARDTRKGLLPLLESGRLNALLVQFPWSFRNVEANRDWLEDVRRAFEDFPLVVEVRHAGWNEPSFFEWLAENGVGFVNIDQPLFKRSIRPSAVGTAHTGYVRVHGRNYMDWFRRNAGRDARYDYLYSNDELKRWVKRTREIAADEQVEEGDGAFNNRYKGQAVGNGPTFEKLATRRKVEVPPPLAEAYPEALEEAGLL